MYQSNQPNNDSPKDIALRWLKRRSSQRAQFSPEQFEKAYGKSTILAMLEKPRQNPIAIEILKFLVKEDYKFVIEIVIALYNKDSEKAQNKLNNIKIIQAIFSDVEIKSLVLSINALLYTKTNISGEVQAAIISHILLATLLPDKKELNIGLIDKLVRSTEVELTKLIVSLAHHYALNCDQEILSTMIENIFNRIAVFNIQQLHKSATGALKILDQYSDENNLLAKTFILSCYINNIKIKSTEKEQKINEKFKNEIIDWCNHLADEPIPNNAAKKTLIFQYCSEMINSHIFHKKDTVAEKVIKQGSNLKTTIFKQVSPQNNSLKPLQAFINKLAKSVPKTINTIPTLDYLKSLVGDNSELLRLNEFVLFWKKNFSLLPIKTTESRKEEITSVAEYYLYSMEERIAEGVNLYLCCKEKYSNRSLLNEKEKDAIQLLENGCVEYLSIVLVQPKEKITLNLVKNLQSLYTLGWPYYPNPTTYMKLAKTELLCTILADLPDDILKNLFGKLSQPELLKILTDELPKDEEKEINKEVAILQTKITANNAHDSIFKSSSRETIVKSIYLHLGDENILQSEELTKALERTKISKPDCQKILSSAFTKGLTSGELLAVSDEKLIGEVIPMLYQRLGNKHFSAKEFDLSFMAQLEYYLETEKETIKETEIAKRVKNKIPLLMESLKALQNKEKIKIISSKLELEYEHYKTAFSVNPQIDQVKYFNAQERADLQVFNYEQSVVKFSYTPEFLIATPCSLKETKLFTMNAWAQFLILDQEEKSSPQENFIFSHSGINFGALALDAGFLKTNSHGFLVTKTNQSPDYDDPDAGNVYQATKILRELNFNFDSCQFLLVNLSLLHEYRNKLEEPHQSEQENESNSYSNPPIASIENDQSFKNGKMEDNHSSDKSYKLYRANFSGDKEKEMIASSQIEKPETVTEKFDKKWAKLEDLSDKICLCFTYQEVMQDFKNCSEKILSELKILIAILKGLTPRLPKKDAESLQTMTFLLLGLDSIIKSTMWEKKQNNLLTFSKKLKHDIYQFICAAIQPSSTSSASSSAKDSSSSEALRKINHLLKYVANHIKQQLDFTTPKSSPKFIPFTDFIVFKKQFDDGITKLYNLFKKIVPHWVTLPIAQDDSYSYIEYFQFAFNEYEELSRCSSTELLDRFEKEAKARNAKYNYLNVPEGFAKVQTESKKLLDGIRDSMRFFKWFFEDETMWLFVLPKEDDYVSFVTVADGGLDNIGSLLTLTSMANQKHGVSKQFPHTISIFGGDNIYSSVQSIIETILSRISKILFLKKAKGGIAGGVDSPDDPNFRKVWYGAVARWVLQFLAPGFFIPGNHDADLDKYSLLFNGGTIEFSEVLKRILNEIEHGYLEKYHPGPISPRELFSQKELDLDYLIKQEWFWNFPNRYYALLHETTKTLLILIDTNTLAVDAYNYFYHNENCTPSNNQICFLLELMGKYQKDYNIIWWGHNPLRTFGYRYYSADTPYYIKKYQLEKLLEALRINIFPEAPKDSEESKMLKALLEAAQDVYEAIFKNAKSEEKVYSKTLYSDIIQLIIYVFKLKYKFYFAGHDHAAYFTSNQAVIGSGGSKPQKHKRFDRDLLLFLTNLGSAHVLIRNSKLIIIFQSIANDPYNKDSICQNKTWTFVLDLSKKDSKLQLMGANLTNHKEKDLIEGLRTAIINAYYEYFDFLRARMDGDTSEMNLAQFLQKKADEAKKKSKEEVKEQKLPMTEEEKEVAEIMEDVEDEIKEVIESKLPMTEEEKERLYKEEKITEELPEQTTTQEPSNTKGPGKFLNYNFHHGFEGVRRADDVHGFMRCNQLKDEEMTFAKIFNTIDLRLHGIFNSKDSIPSTIAKELKEFISSVKKELSPTTHSFLMYIYVNLYYTEPFASLLQKEIPELSTDPKQIYYDFTRVFKEIRKRYDIPVPDQLREYYSEIPDNEAPNSNYVFMPLSKQ